MTYQDLLDNNWIISGSPETVAQRLEEAITETGCGRVILTLNMGIKPQWLVDKSLALFSEQVLPRFRPSGRPLWAQEPNQAGFRTNLEYEHKRRKDVPPPTIVRNGNLIDVTKDHLDGVDPVIGPWPAH